MQGLERITSAKQVVHSRIDAIGADSASICGVLLVRRAAHRRQKLSRPTTI